MEDIQLIKDFEHRSLSIGEGDGGRGRIGLQNDERIATQRKIIRITEAGIINKFRQVGINNN